jgi:hypothetical protein
MADVFDLELHEEEKVEDSDDEFIIEIDDVSGFFFFLIFQHKLRTDIIISHQKFERKKKLSVWYFLIPSFPWQ